ncbi:hypothetical protein [Aquiflexum sp.]
MKAAVKKLKLTEVWNRGTEKGRMRDEGERMKDKGEGGRIRD